MRIEVPRERDGSFEPLLIPKHERRFTGFDDKIVAMYARGMTVGGFPAEAVRHRGYQLGYRLGHGHVLVASVNAFALSYGGFATTRPTNQCPSYT